MNSAGCARTDQRPTLLLEQSVGRRNQDGNVQDGVTGTKCTIHLHHDRTNIRFTLLQAVLDSPIVRKDTDGLSKQKHNNGQCLDPSDGIVGALKDLSL